MNSLKAVCLVACLLVSTCAASGNHNSARRHNNAVSNSHRPSEWLPVNELENLPALDEVNLEDLVNKSPEEGADLVNKIYHISQTSSKLAPSYSPNSNEITVNIPQPNGQRTQFPLNQFVSKIKELQPQFGKEEVTIFLTGLSEEISSVKKANRNLEKAFMQRYYGQKQNWQQKGSGHNNGGDDYSDEDYSQIQEQENQQTGNFVVIDLGEKLDTFEKIATLDVERAGASIGNVLAELSEKNGVSKDVINIIGQGISAQVAGVAGREYTRRTGQKMRRITGLDPWRIYARHENTLTGLARGDADFVDVIHTTAYGLGTPARSGNVDFYPNGPSVSVPGADNIIEASMRATRYYAESVRPGNQKNFPALSANSLQKIYSKNGYAKRVYMGIDTEFDLEGDYMLQVNPTSPFGQYVSSRNQDTYMRRRPALPRI